jgi:hypothetical protein
MEENCIGSQSPQRTVVLEKKKNIFLSLITTKSVDLNDLFLTTIISKVMPKFYILHCYIKKIARI